MKIFAILIYLIYVFINTVLVIDMYKDKYRSFHKKEVIFFTSLLICSIAALVYQIFQL